MPQTETSSPLREKMRETLSEEFSLNLLSFLGMGLQQKEVVVGNLSKNLPVGPHGLSLWLGWMLISQVPVSGSM